MINVPFAPSYIEREHVWLRFVLLSRPGALYYIDSGLLLMDGRVELDR